MSVNRLPLRKAKSGTKAADKPAAKAAAGDEPFWRVKRMSEMTAKEWESLCDGCGRCCLNKLTDIDTNETVYTDVGCELLDGQTCRCTDYAHRQAKVSDCVKLTWRNVKRLGWLPPTCGYRLIAEGRDLAWWHPLVSGDPNTVHEAGVSVRGPGDARTRRTCQTTNWRITWWRGRGSGLAGQVAEGEQREAKS